MGGQVVLVRPEIPGNTGTIGRLCLGFAARLYLVGPLGFSLSEKAVRRAGLDYWSRVTMERYEKFEELIRDHPAPRRLLFTARRPAPLLTAVRPGPEDLLVFGGETEGLPEELLEAHPADWVRLPQTDQIRSHNLANAVAMALYEVNRR